MKKQRMGGGLLQILWRVFHIRKTDLISLWIGGLAPSPPHQHPLLHAVGKRFSLNFGMNFTLKITNCPEKGRGARPISHLDLPMSHEERGSQVPLRWLTGLTGAPSRGGMLPPLPACPPSDPGDSPCPVPPLDPRDHPPLPSPGAGQKLLRFRPQHINNLRPSP